MARVRRVDTDVGLRVILHEQGRPSDVLSGVGADVLAGRRDWARRAAALREPLLGREAEQAENLRRVAAHALRRCRDAGNAARSVAARKRCIRLVALRRCSSMRGCDADPEAERDERPDASSHAHEHSDGMHAGKFVNRLAAARIGATYNFYRQGGRADLRRERLRRYLEDRAGAPLLLVGEAAGFRGARVSGIPFTSERQLTGSGPAEASATIVQRALAELELDALCWNVVPTHPATERSNRSPTAAEVAASLPFLEELASGRRVLAVGRLAERVTGAPYVRHPAHGRAAGFRAGPLRFCAGGRP